MRVTILQHGDYGEAYRRLCAGGPETYRDQRHSVNFVASLAPAHDITTVASCDRVHDELLAPGLRSVGMLPHQFWDRGQLWSLFDRLVPEALICRTPNRFALAWAAARRIPALPMFADYFSDRGLRNRLNNWRVGRVLRRCVRPCVSNHSLSASQSIRRLGIPPDEIVPWEFQRLRPFDEAKMAPPPGRPFRLFFAGMLIESKGIGDCIEAVALLRGKGRRVELSLAGYGDVASWTDLARQRGVTDCIHMLGTISSDRVLMEMRAHDAVVVPSRHDFAEGLPNTLFEALASRCPVIVSDHPAFVRRLRPGEAVIQFPAAQPARLADCVAELMDDPSLYAGLSGNSPAVLDSLYVGIEFTKLVELFLDDPRNTRDWVRNHTLTALQL